MSHQNTSFTLFLTSNASLDLYGENSASKFTNVLKEPIRLDPNLNFELRLANFHMPNVEYILKKDDFSGSSLVYNVGLFQYDADRGRYFENELYTRELFRLAPDRSIEGLYEKSSRNLNIGRKSLRGGGGANVDNAAMDSLGKPYDRVKKEKFLATLNHSLRMKPSTGNRFTNELIFLNLFKEYLNKSNTYEFGTLDNLLINPFLDLNYVQMASFDHLKGRQKNKFYWKLLNWADYTESTREYLSLITGVDNPYVSTERASSRVKRLASAGATGTTNSPKTSEKQNSKKNKNKNNNKHKKHSSSHVDFTNEEVRILHRNPDLIYFNDFSSSSSSSDTNRIKRFATSASSEKYKDLARRWTAFAQEYNKEFEKKKFFC